MGAVFIIVKLFCRSPRKQFLHPLWLRFARSAYSTVLKASWQAYPLLYGHLIFKVQRVRCITPFHRFFFDLFTCPKKYPSICTNREKANYPLFWKLFSICRKFLGFDQRVSSQSVQFAVRKISPQRVGNEKARFTMKIQKNLNFYVLHKKCPLNLLLTKTPFCTKYFETSSKCVKFLLLFKYPLTIRRKRGHNLQVFFKEFFLFFFHFDLPLHWLQKNRVFYKGVFWKKSKLFHKELIWKEKREPNRKTDELSCFSLGPLGARKSGCIVWNESQQ